MATSIKNIIKDENLREIARGVRPDDRKRITLARVLNSDKDISYHVYVNSYGQIILDPQITIPASEIWVFENKDILASIDKGMAETIEGKAIDRGSFAEYAEDES